MTRRHSRPQPYDPELDHLLLFGGGGRQDPCPTGWYFARGQPHAVPPAIPVGSTAVSVPRPQTGPELPRIGGQP